MIEHGVTGVSGSDDCELAHYAAMLAHDEPLRQQITRRTSRLVTDLANPAASGPPGSDCLTLSTETRNDHGCHHDLAQHPRRVSYCEQTLRSLQRNLSATGHELRWLLSAESQAAEDAPWSGPMLQERAERLGLEVHWRDAPPSLPGHLNDIVRSLSTPLWFYVQDDWELVRPLDLGPAADLLLAHDDLGGVRFWANTGYVGQFEGFAVVDPAAAWSYGDNPALWHRRFFERVGPFDVGGWFGHHEEAASARWGASGLRVLADPAVQRHAAHYFFHLGEMSSIPGDVRFGHGERRRDEAWQRIEPDCVPKTNAAEWHITYRCDLACTNCNRLCFLPPTTPDMTLEDARDFVRQAKDLNWSPELAILGGEPTLHHDLFELLAIANELSPGRVTVWSNGFRADARRQLDRIRSEGLAQICEGTLKPAGSIIHPQNDFFIAPIDFNVPERTPCHLHCRSGCGVSVDSGGYTLCPLGGAIDSVLDTKLRTRRLADLFDPVFAQYQTRALCRLCGHELHIDSLRISQSQVLRGSLMSPTWQQAVNRIHQCRQQQEPSP